LRPLRSSSRATAAVVLPQKSILDLRVDFVKPLLRAVGFVLINSNLSLQFRDPVFGRSELMGKLLRHIERMFAIGFCHPGGLVQQTQNGLPCFIELIIGSYVFRSRCKWND
jgi:hypothetical protein